MTIEKANIVVGNLPIYPDDCYNHEEYKEAKSMALEALQLIGKYGGFEAVESACEKQISKRPHRNYSKTKDVWCSCGWYLGVPKTLIWNEEDYCPHCGQRQDWSDEK